MIGVVASFPVARKIMSEPMSENSEQEIRDAAEAAWLAQEWEIAFSNVRKQRLKNNNLPEGDAQEVF